MSCAIEPSGWRGGQHTYLAAGINGDGVGDWAGESAPRSIVQDVPRLEATASASAQWYRRGQL